MKGPWTAGRWGSMQATDGWTRSRSGVEISCSGPEAYRAGGSATVEAVVIVPFLFLVLAAVWDLREYIGYRTELVREMYVVAEAIADDPEGGQPFEVAIFQAEERLRQYGAAGVIRAAVVVRGTARPDGVACVDGEWCLPRVTVAWPPPAVEEPAGTWSRGDDNACLTEGNNPLPGAGEHFESGQRVLPNEDADSDEGDWISRNLRATEWWVVIDTCVHPQPGLFLGRLTGFSESMLDLSFALRRRAVWGSIHDRSDCDWC